MKKYLLPVLLVIVLVGGLFVLTGCGEKKEEPKQENNNTTEVATENTATESGSTNTQQIEAVYFYLQNLVPNTTIKSAYASVSGADIWTANLLNGLELATGTQANMALGITEATSIWDFKLTDEEGVETTIKSVDLSQILTNKGGNVAIQLDENNQPTIVVK